MANRIESDFLGSKSSPKPRITACKRSAEEAPYHGHPDVMEPNFVKAFGYVKKAAAAPNRDLGVLDESPTRSVQLRPADRRRHARRFVTDFIQGGAGTSTNMNANEVIANLWSGWATGRAAASSAARTITSSDSRPTTSIRPRSASR